MSFVTRFAPSPTGLLHLGHVASALYVWSMARTRGAQVLLRIEDHDAEPGETRPDGGSKTGRTAAHDEQVGAAAGHSSSSRPRSRRSRVNARPERAIAPASRSAVTGSGGTSSPAR